MANTAKGCYGIVVVSKNSADVDAVHIGTVTEWLQHGSLYSGSDHMRVPLFQYFRRG